MSAALVVLAVLAAVGWCAAWVAATDSRTLGSQLRAEWQASDLLAAENAALRRGVLLPGDTPLAAAAERHVALVRGVS